MFQRLLGRDTRRACSAHQYHGTQAEHVLVLGNTELQAATQQAQAEQAVTLYSMAPLSTRCGKQNFDGLPAESPRSLDTGDYAVSCQPRYTGQPLSVNESHLVASQPAVHKCECRELTEPSFAGIAYCGVSDFLP